MVTLFNIVFDPCTSINKYSSKSMLQMDHVEGCSSKTSVKENVLAAYIHLDIYLTVNVWNNIKAM